MNSVISVMHTVESALNSLQCSLKQKITQSLVIMQGFEAPPVGAPSQNFENLFWDQASTMALLI